MTVSPVAVRRVRQTEQPPARPYSTRDEAVSDAFFASRMLQAMGDEVAVFVEGPGGIVETNSETEHVWRRH